MSGRLTKVISHHIPFGMTYRLLWANYLIFHTFFSQSDTIPLPQRLIVFITGLIPVLIFPFTRNSWPLVIHKIVFIAGNIYPMAIDSRVTFAIFESLVFVSGFLGKKKENSLSSLNLMILTIVMFFSGFHKLNSDHFGPGNCSEFLASQSVFGSFKDFLPWIVVSGELILAVRLFFTRKLGFPLILFGIFTTSVTLLGFQQFMAVLWVGAFPLLSKKDEKTKVFFLIVSVLSAMISFASGDTYLGISLMSSAIIWLLILFTGPSPEVPTPGKTAVFVTVTLVTLNCLTPYLGWKSSGSFNMYSNLRIEKERTNHFIIRKPLLLSRNLIETVTVLETNLPRYSGLLWLRPEVPEKILKTELHKARREGFAATAKFIRNGETVVLDSPEEIISYTEDLPAFESYFLGFSMTTRGPYCF